MVADGASSPLRPVGGERHPTAPAAATRISAQFMAATRKREMLEREHALHAARFASSASFGLIVWSLFFGVDLVVVYRLGCGTPAYFLTLRLVSSAVFVASILLMRRQPPLSPGLRCAIDLTLYTVLCGAISLMCLPFRGIGSPYGPGICLVLTHRMLSANEPWTRGALMHGIPAATYPLTMGVAAAVDPGIAQQFHDGKALGLFSINLAFIFGTTLLCSVGGHIVGALRRDVVEARSVGRYRLKERVGSGSSGEVWCAHDAELGRDVALKMLRADRTDEVGVSRFEREVQATCGLTHPNTVRVFDFGVSADGRCYYTMELLAGENLSTHVRRCGPFPVERALAVFIQVARALGEAHARGIVHRDVKPSNVFLVEAGANAPFAKVLDFGIARVVQGEAETTLTSTGTIVGSPAYISPEAVTGRVVDARADVYGAGALLYFMLTGRPPFETDDGAMGLLVAHASRPPQRPSKKSGIRLPEDVEDVVMRCLEKDPADRYEDGAALAAAVLRCRAGRGPGSSADADPLVVES
jgi:eukaryotic-like serine/threonine-protein kinase